MFPSVCVNCFPMSRGELCLSLLFYGDYIFSTTFFPHSVLLYYKSSSHFKPFFFINILWKPSFTFKWYFMLYNFVLFLKIVQPTMILLHYFEFVSDGVVSIRWSSIHISNAALLWQDYTTVLKNQGNIDYVWREVFEAIKIWSYRY